MNLLDKTNYILKLQLEKLNIIVDTTTGQLKYAPEFKPLKTEFDLVLVRHGETYGNCGQVTADGKIDKKLVRLNKKNDSNRIFQGTVDTEINQLTELGRKQAAHAVAKLEKLFWSKNRLPDIIFHSPLTRAKETGLPFIEKHGLHARYHVYPGICEMSFGAWDNRRLCDFKADDSCHLFYTTQHALVKQSGLNGNQTFTVAENFCEVLMRANFVLQLWNCQYPGKKILAFTHSLFGAACCILYGLGIPLEGAQHLAFDGKRPNGSHYLMPHATPILLTT